MSEQNDSYLELNLSRMLESPPCAVRCRSELEADALLHNFKQQYPNRVKNWSDGYPSWGSYADKTCYTLFYAGAHKPTSLSFCDIDWFTENGYEVIEFAGLIGEQEEIEESEMPIELLFGLN